MPPPMLNVNGQRFVVIPEQEYREYRSLKKTAKAKPAAKKPRTSRMTQQDWGDVAESIRRLAKPGKRVSAIELFKRLGV